MTSDEFMIHYNGLWNIGEFLSNANEDLDVLGIFSEASGYTIFSDDDVDYTLDDLVHNACHDGIGWREILSGLDNTSTSGSGYYFTNSESYDCSVVCIDDDEWFIDTIKEYIVDNHPEFFDDVIEEEDSQNECECENIFKYEIDRRKAKNTAAKTEVIRFGADVCVSGLYR